MFVKEIFKLLAADIIYNTITLTPDVKGEPDEKLVNQVAKINEMLNDNLDELYNLFVDYYYAGWAAMEFETYVC